jgi:hypothetical protein
MSLLHPSLLTCHVSEIKTAAKNGLGICTTNKNPDLEDNIFVYLIILQVDTIGGALPFTECYSS